MKMFSSKKGVIDNLIPLVIGLVVIGVVLAVGFLIMSNIASNTAVAAEPNATRAIQTTITAMAGIPGWLGVIIIVVIGALLIGLVSMFNRRQ